MADVPTKFTVSGGNWWFSDEPKTPGERAWLFGYHSNESLLADLGHKPPCSIEVDSALCGHLTSVHECSSKCPVVWSSKMRLT